MLSPARFARFEDAYVAVLAQVSRDFDFTVAPRGNACRECLNISFVLDDHRDRAVYVPARPTDIVFCFAEALWYLWGRYDLEMVSYYAPRLARYRFIAMHMIAITPSAGGISCVHDPRDPRNPVPATRLTEPGGTLIVDDRHVLHEVSSVLSFGGEGHRDMLIIDFRHPIPGYQHVRSDHSGDESAATPSAPASPSQPPADLLGRTT